jgi:hypothetical protein
VLDIQALGHDKVSGKTFLKSDQSKCLHYYFYLLDEELGLCYVRVPTWLPCRLQVYCNGHNWLALQLKRKGIAFKLVDNAFTEVGDWERAQKISDGWEARRLHGKLDAFARRFCPIFKHFGVVYHWSLDQAEYAPPMWSSNVSPTWRPFTTISPELLFTPSSPTISPPSSGP